MNVTNSPIATEVKVIANGLKSAKGESNTSANLFLQQVASLLENMQGTDMLAALPEGLSTEDVNQLAGLMAMLQQLLQVAPVTIEQFPGEMATDEPDKLGAEVIGKLSTLLNNLTSGSQTSPLNPSVVKEQLIEMAALFKGLKEKIGSEGNQGTRQISDQIQQLLEQMAGKMEVSKQQTIKTKAFVALPLHFHASVGKSSNVQPQNGNISESNMKLQQAISAYGFENVNPLASSTPSIVSEDQPQVPVYSVRANDFTGEVTDLFVKQMKLGTQNGLTEAKLILNPQSLGQVDVKITAQNGVITATLIAETQNGKELLDNQLSQLRQALQQQGLQVDKIEVQHQPQSQNQQSFPEQGQREQARQQGNTQQENKAEESSEFSLEELLQSIDSTNARVNTSA